MSDCKGGSPPSALNQSLMSDLPEIVDSVITYRLTGKFTFKNLHLLLTKFVRDFLENLINGKHYVKMIQNVDKELENRQRPSTSSIN